MTAALGFLYSPASSGEDSPPDWSIFLPDDPAKQLTVDLCSSCHDLQPVVTRRGDVAFWQQRIRYMNSEWGAMVRPPEVAVLSEYLGEHFGKEVPRLEIPINLNKADRAVIELLKPISRHADAIVTTRLRDGGFRSVEELRAIRGLTDEQFEKVKPFLSVD
jgi:hypothetical protein